MGRCKTYISFEGVFRGIVVDYRNHQPRRVYFCSRTLRDRRPLKLDARTCTRWIRWWGRLVGSRALTHLHVTHESRYTNRGCTTAPTARRAPRTRSSNIQDCSRKPHFTVFFDVPKGVAVTHSGQVK